MIGVIPKVNQRPLVDEFFQLFKTPWELWQPGRRYDAVVATADEIPEVDARLFVIYGAEGKRTDAKSGIGAGSWHYGGSLDYRGQVVPIYGDLRTFDRTSAGVPLVTLGPDAAGLRLRSTESTVVRLGYDLFEELRLLLSAGQPVEWAHVPTVDIHIKMLKEVMLGAGITFAEIPAAPAGYAFGVCLTHDIDFVGIRDHRFDHTMWGFLYRSTVGALKNVLRRRTGVRRLLKIWRAVAALPFVYLGWAKDFWSPFEWYLQVEKHLPATYFLIPFKRRPGQRVPDAHPSRRATAYDITDIPRWTATLMQHGCEVGVHGIDAWHSVEKGRDEFARIATSTGKSRIGIRMHWLLQDENTCRVLEDAGYAYDSTAGYNEAVGYRNGTTQVFRPPTAQALRELPIHIQDGALFYPQRLDLSESEAWTRCADLIDNAQRFGGVLTILWHDRSHGPERFWGDFYKKLVAALRERNAWFATAGQAVDWFQKRRDVRFEECEAEDSSSGIRLRCHGEKIQPPLTIRLHRKSAVVDTRWNGESAVELPVGVPAKSPRAGAACA